MNGVNGKIRHKKDDDDDDDDDDDKHKDKVGTLNASPKAAQVGTNGKFKANLYVPNGTLLIRSKAQATGSFIGRDVSVGSQARLSLQSGWDTGVTNDPPALTKLALTKPVLFDEEEEAQTEEIAEDQEFGMDQNYPNPFNPSTTIRYTLAEASEVRLVIYNVLGQEVRRLVHELQGVGAHGVVWDGRDAFGRGVATGVYIYRLQAGLHVALRKMIFAK